jgi:hypothetical protein
MAKDLKKSNDQINDLKDQDNLIGINDLNDDRSKSKKMTKKMTTIQFLDRDGGVSINQIAQGYLDINNDPDLDKNRRVARLWISKIGFKVESKKDDKGIKYYFRSK